MQGQAVYGKSLDLPLCFLVNLKLLLSKSPFKRKGKTRHSYIKYLGICCTFLVPLSGVNKRVNILAKK